MNSLIESSIVMRPAPRKKYELSKRADINSRILDAILLYRYHLIGVENYIVRVILYQFKSALNIIDDLLSDKNPELIRLLSIGRLYPSAIPIKESVEVTVPLSSTTIMEARKPKGKSPLSPQGAKVVADYIIVQLGPRVGGTVNIVNNIIQQAILRVADTEPKIIAELMRRALPKNVLLKDDPPLDRIANIVAGNAKHRAALQKRYGTVMKKVEMRLVDGLLQGKGIKDIARDLRGVLSRELAGGASMLARTELQRAAAKSGKELYGHNKDIIKAEVWTTALDTNVCLVCGNLDGNRYTVGVGPQPVDDTHPGCRCIRSPVVKSWRELGIDVDDAPAGFRASMGGAVPARVTFKDWFKRQSSTDQKEILGKSRYELYKSGELELNQFVANNRILTINKLKRKYKIK